MGQMGAHPAQAPERRTGRRPSASRGGQPWTGRPLEALVHAPNAAALGVPKPVATQIFRKLAGAAGLAPGKLRAQLIPDSTWKRAGKILGPSASQTVSRLASALFVAAVENLLAALEYGYPV